MSHSIPPKQRKFEGDDGLELSGSGQRMDTADAHGTLPDKKKGVHRWIVSTAYSVSDPEAVIKHSVMLDVENLLYAALGCVDCEMPYETINGTKCRAGDTWGKL